MRKQENKIVSEPSVAYKRNLSLTSYASFNEMNEADILAMAKLPVSDRIKNTVELILRAYNLTREDLKKRNSSKKISSEA